MYQLSPVSLKPNVKASRSQHGPFQNKLAKLVEKLSTEREIVDLEHETGRKLFNSMDSFFAYGLLSGDKVYWRFVREFLPKTQQQLLRAEWGDIDDRRLSIAWLKDAFNRSTLHFQMLAFRNNRRFIERFYHRNACMSNGGMLEAVTDMITSLVNVQFAFYSTLSLRTEPARAVVVEPPATPIATARAKRRKRTESLRNQPPVLSETIPADLETIPVPSPKDQDAILDELMRMRKSRLHGYEDNNPNAKVESNMDSGVNTSGDSSGPPPRSEGFEEVVRKTMSQANMENLGELEAKSFDSLLQYEELPHEKHHDDDTLIEGEVMLHSGDILKLAMNVYVNEGERLLHMYHVYQRFAAGMPHQRLLAVTDHNVYVITQNIVQEESARTGVFEEGGHNNVFYEVHAIVPLSAIDYIGVSTDSQVIILYAKSGMPFHAKTETEGSKDKICPIATADVQLGKAIVKTITTAVEDGNQEPPPVFTESTPYSLIIKRYLTKELNGSPHIELRYFALAYWKESSACLEKQNAENVGYLYRRMVPPYWWRKPPAEWFQSYFVLKGSKMYVFTDSTCKEGEMVINLGDCTEVLELDSKKDCQWGFELVLPEGNLQLQCPSKDEMNKWMQLVKVALNSLNDDDAAACMVMITDTNLVVAQEGEKCFTDGFIRTLVSFTLPEIRSGWVVQTEAHMILLLRVDALYQWFFFRSKDELNRIVRLLSDYPIPLTEVNQNSQEKTAVYVLNECGKIPDLWHKAIFASEGFETEP
uniref:RUN domain-containing protein n=1 Tax=Haemonchus contortus TaxID=6289 RepID=A0A7I5EBH2_HAECO